MSQLLGLLTFGSRDLHPTEVKNLEFKTPTGRRTLQCKWCNAETSIFLCLILKSQLNSMVWTQGNKIHHAFLHIANQWIKNNPQIPIWPQLQYQTKHTGFFKDMQRITICILRIFNFRFFKVRPKTIIMCHETGMPWWCPPTPLHTPPILTFSVGSEQRSSLVWGTWGVDQQNKAFTQWQSVTSISMRSLGVTPSLIVACFWISCSVTVTPVESRCDSFWLLSG